MASPGRGRAGSGVGVTVDSRSAGTYGDRDHLRAGAGGKRLVVSSWAACGAEVAVACPDGCRGEPAQPDPADATLQPRGADALWQPLFMSSRQACVCCGWWMRVRSMAPCALAGRDAATRSLIVRRRLAVACLCRHRPVGKAERHSSSSIQFRPFPPCCPLLFHPVRPVLSRPVPSCPVPSCPVHPVL